MNLSSTSAVPPCCIRPEGRMRVETVMIGLQTTELTPLHPA